MKANAIKKLRCPIYNKIIVGRGCPPCFGIKNGNDECDNKCIECKKEVDKCKKDTVESDSILRVTKTLLFKI